MTSILNEIYEVPAMRRDHSIKLSVEHYCALLYVIEAGTEKISVNKLGVVNVIVKLYI